MRSGETVELDFGAKQFAWIALIVAGGLGGAFLVGMETGYKRAERGQPSLLAFLETEAQDHTAPVPIPEVLLRGDAEERAKARAIAGAQEPPPPDRQKPIPVLAESSGGQPGAAPPGGDVQVPDPPSPIQASENGSVRLQVAALRSRSNAEGLLGWLLNNGFPALVETNESDGFMRVFVGPFEDAEAAEQGKVRLEQEGFKPVLVPL